MMPRLEGQLEGDLIEAVSLVAEIRLAQRAMDIAIGPMNCFEA